MASSKIYKMASGINVEAVGSEIQNFLRNNKGLKTTGWNTPAGYEINAESENAALGVVGLSLSQNVRVSAQGDMLRVETTPGWANKIAIWAVVGVMFLIFLCLFWPLIFVMIPVATCAAIGTEKQYKLTSEIFAFTDRLAGGQGAAPGGMNAGYTAPYRAPMNTGTPVSAPVNTSVNTPVSTPGTQCPRCHAVVAAGEKFCISCGQKLDEAPAQQVCRQCGAPLEEGQKFCYQCGTQV